MTIALHKPFAELKSAMDVYLNDYGKHLPDVVKSKSSYENYRNLMLKVLECKRNENDKPLDATTAKTLADELYNAGGSRSLGETDCCYCDYSSASRHSSALELACTFLERASSPLISIDHSISYRHCARTFYTDIQHYEQSTI